MTTIEQRARDYAERRYPPKEFKNVYNWDMVCREHAESFAAGIREGLKVAKALCEPPSGRLGGWYYWDVAESIQLILDGKAELKEASGDE